MENDQAEPRGARICGLAEAESGKTSGVPNGSNPIEAKHTGRGHGPGERPYTTFRDAIPLLPGDADVVLTGELDVLDASRANVKRLEVVEPFEIEGFGKVF